MLESVRLAINDVLTDSRATIPAKVVAERMGVPLSTLYSYGELGPTGRDVPLSKLVRLVHAAEDARPVAALCRAVGGYYLPLPESKPDEVSDALVECIKDFGATVQEVATALKGGALTAAELRTIQADVVATQAALAHLLAAAEAQSEAQARRSK